MVLHPATFINCKIPRITGFCYCILAQNTFGRKPISANPSRNSNSIFEEIGGWGKTERRGFTWRMAFIQVSYGEYSPGENENGPILAKTDFLFIVQIIFIKVEQNKTKTERWQATISLRNNYIFCISITCITITSISSLTF